MAGKRQMHKNVRSEKGYTLIELMIVVAIIGILATASYVSYETSIERGRTAPRTADIMNLASKLEIYRQGRLSYQGATAANTYKNAVVVAGKNMFTLEVQVATNNRSYMIVSRPIAGGPGVGDGAYWFNPNGRNCHMDNDNDNYNSNCTGGEEW